MFQLICSYVFWPLAFLMGVDTGDCPRVAELVGIKTFINEFVAYTELSVYIDNAKNLSWYEGLAHGNNSNVTSGVFNATWRYVNGDIVYDDLNITLVGGVLSVSPKFGNSNHASTGSQYNNGTTQRHVPQRSALTITYTFSL